MYPLLQQVAYPDIGPVMLLSEASVKDLSSKLEKGVTVERFRPSVVISDCEAFQEVCLINTTDLLCLFIVRSRFTSD